MSDTQITLEFLANTDGLKAAAQQMQLLGKISKEQYEQFIKLGAENEKMLKQQAIAQQALGSTTQKTAYSAKELNNSFRQFNQTIVQGNLTVVIQQFSQVTTQISAMGKQTADTTEKVKKLGDTAPLKEFINGLKDITKTLSAAKDVAAGLGTETTGLQAAITDLQTATDVMSKAQETYNVLVGENGSLTKAAGVAQTAYTAIVGTSTGALKAFRIALASTGILAAVAAVTELVLNWDKVRAALFSTGAELDKISPKQQALNQLISTANDHAAGEIAKLQVLRQSLINEQLPRQQRLKALAEYNKMAGDGNRIAVTEIDNIDKVNKKIEERVNLVLALATVEAAQEQIKQKVSERLKLEAQMREAERKDLVALANARKAVPQNIEKVDETGSMKSSFDEDVKIAEAKVVLNKKASANLIKAKQEEINVILGLIKEYQEKYKNILFGTDTTKTTNIPPNFNEENARSFAAANQKWIAEQKAGVQELIDAEEERRLHLQAGSDEEVAAYRNIIELKKQMAELDYGFTSPAKLKLTLTQLEDEYQAYYASVLQSRTESNQQALAQLKANHAIDEGLLRDHYVTLEEIDADYVQFQNETGQTSYEQFEEWERKKLEARKRTNAEMSEDDKKIIETAISITQQATDTMFTIQANNRQARLDADLQALEKARDKELQNKNLTEQQKDAINKRYADQEAKLKRRAYEQDKQAKLAQAAINGALAITNILATRPKSDFGIGDAIMIATAVASTAAQIAVIASTPVPQFARGGKNIPAGMKLVGEQGPELIWTPGGETVIPHGDTAKILEAWSIPVPNVNPALKTDAAIAAALPAGIDYNKLAQAFAQELRNNPSVNISMDNNGFAMHLLQKNKSVQLLNNRYSA